MLNAARRCGATPSCRDWSNSLQSPTSRLLPSGSGRFLPLQNLCFSYIDFRTVQPSCHPRNSEQYTFATFCPAVTTTSGRFAPRHPRKCRVWLSLCGSIPTQSLCSGRWFFAKQSDFVDESAIQVEPSVSLKCFKSLPLRNRPARGRGQTWRNTLRPDIGNHIEQPGSVAEARDRPLRSTQSDVPCAWLILRSCPSGVGLSAP